MKGEDELLCEKGKNLHLILRSLVVPLWNWVF